MSEAPSVEPSAEASIDPNDLLAKIQAAGVIRIGTDPAYPPQSELTPDGEFVGFDIDTANEIAKRLGVKAQFETPDFAVVENGTEWQGRFRHQRRLGHDHREAQGNARFHRAVLLHPGPHRRSSTTRGITTLEGLAGKTICVGEATTYFQWAQGTLVLGDGSELAPVPEGMKVTSTLKTDQDLRALDQVRAQGLRRLAGELVDHRRPGHRRRFADDHRR